jgi:hypothetical protein
VDFLFEDVEEAGFADLLGRLGPFEDRSGGVAELAETGWHGDWDGDGRVGGREGVLNFGRRRRPKKGLRLCRKSLNGRESSMLAD